jgi:hypothetical protein
MFRRIVAAGILVLLAGGLVLLRIYNPATSTIFPPCPIHYLTGWYCPGCGSLRATHQLLLGNVGAAWAMNPLSMLLFPFLTYGLSREAISYLRGQPSPQFAVPGACIRALCALIVLFGIVRNLPFHPFDLLAPGGMLKF